MAVVSNSNAILMGVIRLNGTNAELHSWQKNTNNYIELKIWAFSSIIMRIWTPTWDEVPFLSDSTVDCRSDTRGNK